MRILMMLHQQSIIFHNLPARSGRTVKIFHSPFELIWDILWTNYINYDFKCFNFEFAGIFNHHQQQQYYDIYTYIVEKDYQDYPSLFAVKKVRFIDWFLFHILYMYRYTIYICMYVCLFHVMLIIFLLGTNCTYNVFGDRFLRCYSCGIAHIYWLCIYVCICALCSC